MKGTKLTRDSKFERKKDWKLDQMAHLSLVYEDLICKRHFYSQLSEDYSSAVQKTDTRNSHPKFVNW